MKKIQQTEKSNRSKFITRRNRLGVALSILLGSSGVHARTITVISGGCELTDAILAANKNQAVG